MAEHAKLSPSGAHRWMRCPGSLLFEMQYPDETSVYAEEGTKAHAYASHLLDPSQECPDDVSSEMHEYVADYVALVQSYASGGHLLVEQRVQFSEWIGVENSFGTSDAVILHDGVLTIIDLKYGMGVKVDAVENEQLMLYALGCLYEFGWMGDFQEIRMVIHMPRLNHVSEYVVPVTHLLAFAEKAKAAAELALQPNAPLNPGEKQCRFCRAKADCAALREEVAYTVSGATAADFEDLSETYVPEDAEVLALAMSKVDMIEKWCKAIRAEVERKLVSGDKVPGFLLVEGRLGPRKWKDPEEVEKRLKALGLKEADIYDFSLISPTKAQKVLKTDPAKWEEVQDLILREPGKPSVAPATDRRPEITGAATAEDFG